MYAARRQRRGLLLGNRLKETERAAVLDRLAYFTGLSADLLKKNGLRFSEQEFSPWSRTRGRRDQYV